MRNQRGSNPEEHRLHMRRLLLSIVYGAAIGSTIGVLRLVTIF
jgi:hypothetical protein